MILAERGCKNYDISPRDLRPGSPRHNVVKARQVLFDFRKSGPQGQVRDDRLCLRSTLVFGFSPPWCEMTVLYCSLYKIPTMSYRPDSYKVRSGPGVSGVGCQKNLQSSVSKIFTDLDSQSYPTVPKTSC